MKLPRVRFTIVRLMIWVAILSVFTYVVIEAEQGGCMPPRDEKNKGVVIAVTVAFGLGALRHPWISLAIAMSLKFALPTLYDGGGDTLCEGVFLLGWAIGAPAGWIYRRFGRKVRRDS